MTWDNFIWFAVPSAALWLTAGLLAYDKKRHLSADISAILGICVFVTFITGFWINLGRPPMRTMGETRLWYSLFLAAVGYLTYRRWRYPWLLTYSAVVATVFIVVNLLKPEIHSKNLMPALQSIWFVPHVTVYILSYAMLGAATIASVIQLRHLSKERPDEKVYTLADNLVYAGFGFLMLGMLMGAVWAKQAWGHYWSWDPKETWALVTAAAYLVYIHMRLRRAYPSATMWVLPVAFILLMITWIGVNYLPAARASIHVY
ncbi:MAG: cytochrome c biogenesis protein CcsA [Rikenellaceae bacterium]|nr:cytochrome c biogenesis protein CcsA [Rikenellaceae bacterium]